MMMDQDSAGRRPTVLVGCEPVSAFDAFDKVQALREEKGRAWARDDMPKGQQPRLLPIPGIESVSVRCLFAAGSSCS